jgi:septal ring factor EnvC (AmiA/AmiB activator)
MKKFQALADDDEAWSAHQPLTVGAMSKAAADAKAALASTREIDDRLDDVDQLLKELEKSSAALGECLKSIEARGKAFDDEIAKLRAAPDVLPKAMAWERALFEKQWAVSGSRVDFETYLAQIEYSRAEMRKRAERDAEFDSEPVSDARFNAQYRVVK